MKKIIILLPVILCMVSFFIRCDNGSGGSSDAEDADSGKLAMTELYGSYWGTVTVSETEYDLCVDVRADTISLYSDNMPSMSNSYTNITYSDDDDGTWTFAAFADDDADRTDALCTGTFTVTDGVKTCVVTIMAMNTTSNTLTLGYDYAALDEIYGSYWGTMTVYGSDYHMCLYANNDYIFFLSDAMSMRYTNFAYSRGEDGRWTFKTYKDYDTEQTGYVRCQGVFTVTGSERTCIAEIVPMQTSTNTLTLGIDYDGRYDTLDELYGSYWGTFNYAGVDYDICVTYTESDILIYTDGTWSWSCSASYNQDYNTSIWSYSGSYNSSVVTTGSFDASIYGKSEVTINPLGVTATLSLGEDYDGQFD